jgi:transposase
LHAVCDGKGRPLVLLLSKGQVSDHKGAALMLPNLPGAKELLGDKGYDSNRFRQAMIKRGIAPCIPSSRSRKAPIPYDKALYRQCHRVENMFVIRFITTVPASVPTPDLLGIPVITTLRDGLPLSHAIPHATRVLWPCLRYTSRRREHPSPRLRRSTPRSFCHPPPATSPNLYWPRRRCSSERMMTVQEARP